VWSARNVCCRRNDGGITPEEIRDLPSSWYANQDIPVRLLRAIAAPATRSQAASKAPLDVKKAVFRSRHDLSLVEQAHVRATNRVVRQVLPSDM
jgi:hypothetical protein